MDVIYTDENLNEIGYLEFESLDCANGLDENDFEIVQMFKKRTLNYDYYWYVPNSEWGGIVDDHSVNTQEKTVTYKGRSWHGFLEAKVIEPTNSTTKRKVSGDANTIISGILSLCSLNSLFVAESSNSGITISNYEFEMYVNAYLGLKDMLSSKSAKLTFRFDDVNKKVVVGATSSIDYANNEEWLGDQMSLTINSRKNYYNHLICLGKDGLVLHLYRNANNVISKTKSITNLKEITYVQDMETIDDATKLEENGRKTFADLLEMKEIESNFGSEECVFDIGDIVGAENPMTEESISAIVNKKILQIIGGKSTVRVEV